MRTSLPPKYPKAVAIFLAVVAFGAVKETFRVFSEEAPDFGLRVTAVSFTLACFIGAIVFWFKKSPEVRK